MLSLEQSARTNTDSVRIIPLLAAGALVATFAGCGPSSQAETDEGWTFDEPSSHSPPEHPSRKLLPEEFVNHPAEDRDFAFEKPECTADGRKHPHPYPIVGKVLLFQSIYHEYLDHAQRINLYVKFPNKSKQWHRFELRSDEHPGTEGEAWKAPFGSGTRVSKLSPSLLLRRFAPDCQLPAKKQVESFLRGFFAVEVLVENTQTGEVVAFDYDYPQALAHREPYQKGAIGEAGKWKPGAIKILWELPMRNDVLSVHGTRVERWPKSSEQDARSMIRFFNEQASED